MSTIKPIVLWGHKTGPNSWKVALVLEELGIPYKHKFIELAECKSPEYVKLNPNGRVPTIQDPNTGLTIWESGACIDYLGEMYDKSNALFPQDMQTKWTARSWRDLQMSGQGPYFGQYSWFINYHPEKIASVQDRYKNEILRLIGVMNEQLSKTQYLAGNRLTYADLMWIPYFIVAFRVKGVDFEKEFPSWERWWGSVKKRPSVEKVWDEWMARRREVLGYDVKPE